jgi:tRNA pseudouridine55 synthase
LSKESYYKKHLDRQGIEISDDRSARTVVSISDTAKASFEEGRMLLIDKPLHWTSFDVVRKIRNAIRIKKVGHAGTLDPLATGLLIICTGKYTKKINEYMAKEKEYTGSFTLGATTPTYDLESEPEHFTDISKLSEEQIQNTVHLFKGEIMQVPPIYSAIKKKGTPLYELARRGEDAEIQPRPIVIHDFVITGIELPVVYFKIRCSTGTYIRSIASEFGKALGCGAYLSSLRRTAIGECLAETASTMDTFLEKLATEK